MKLHWLLEAFLNFSIDPLQREYEYECAPIFVVCVCVRVGERERERERERVLKQKKNIPFAKVDRASFAIDEYVPHLVRFRPYSY